jgi:hypothetical protein
MVRHAVYNVMVCVTPSWVTDEYVVLNDLEIYTNVIYRMLGLPSYLAS